MADAGADKALHFVAEFVKHPADLAVQTLLEDDPQTGRAKLLYRVSRARLPSRKIPWRSFSASFGAPESVEGDLLFFFHLVTRMREVLREVAIAREEKQTLGLGVETADVEKAGKLRRQ